MLAVNFLELRYGEVRLCPGPIGQGRRRGDVPTVGNHVLVYADTTAQGGARTGEGLGHRGGVKS